MIQSGKAQQAAGPNEFHKLGPLSAKASAKEELEELEEKEVEEKEFSIVFGAPDDFDIRNKLRLAKSDI